MSVNIRHLRLVSAYLGGGLNLSVLLGGSEFIRTSGGSHRRRHVASKAPYHMCLYSYFNTGCASNIQNLTL